MRFIKSKKTLLVTLLTVLLIAVIGTGSTLAYYSAGAGEANNVFSFSEDIRARLTEPNWDVAEGKKMVPGKEIAKDPMITNTCKTEEYVAIKLTFQNSAKTAKLSDSDYTKLMSLLVIDWNTADWTVLSGAGTKEQVWIYNGVLTAGKVSTPVFHSIRVKTKADGITEADLRWLQEIKIVDGDIVTDIAGLGGFNLKVEGAAVQASGYANASAAGSTLASLF